MMMSFELDELSCMKRVANGPGERTSRAMATGESVNE
jgi:hypothetical protein